MSAAKSRTLFKVSGNGLDEIQIDFAVNAISGSFLRTTYYLRELFDPTKKSSLNFIQKLPMLFENGQGPP